MRQSGISVVRTRKHKITTESKTIHLRVEITKEHYKYIEDTGTDSVAEWIVRF